MATRKSEWLASIKPILDRDEAKRDAKELAKELGDLLEIDIDTSPESLKKLTDEFNKQLSQMGKQPIVFSEKTLHGIVNQFANAVAEGFSNGANVGLEETFKLQLANLKKQKEALLKEQEDIKQRVNNRSRIEKLNKFEISNAQTLPVDGDVVKQAEQMLDKMYEYADRIAEIQAEQGKDSEAYISTVLDAQEAYNEFLRMQKTLKKIKPAMPDDLKAAYDLFKGDEEDRYRTAGGRTNAFNYDQYGGEIILDAFEEISDVLINTDDQLDDIQKRLKEIDLQIENIVAQSKAAGALDDAILGDSKDGLKTLKEIEAAYDRIAKKNKKTGGKAIDGVSAAIDYVPGSESLTTLRNRYNTSLSSNEDWEVQYQWLVKFVKEYENYSAQIEAETDSIKRKNMKARQKQYTALYEELKPMAENAETMLRGIIDVSGGKQPSGVKDTNKQDSDMGPTQEDVANAEKIAALERTAREEADAKAKAEAEAAEAAKQKRIEEEKAAKAAEKKRLADEAAAEANRKAAEEAERERLAKEASVAADKTGAYTGYRAIEPPSGSGKTKDDALTDWGGEYFSTDPKVAASYGENFFEKGNIIIGEITPKNPLVINANGLRWDEFDKMPGVKELFPGILELMKDPRYIGDDGQKYINEQARQAGYDSVILENVQDALDGDIKSYDLSTTIAVLDDKIVSLTGSMAQLEAGTNKFSNVVSPEIPSYYVGGQRGGKDSVTEVQDVGTEFKRLIDYIKSSGQEPKQFFDALAGGAQNVDDELKQILTTLDLFDSQGNLNLKSIESGFTNLGGMVSDTYTLIARGKDYLPKSHDLMPKLEDAKKMGANVGEILDVFEDEATGRIYELQRTMPGTIIPDNTDFLQATDDQILNLIADLQTLHKTGLYVDFGNDNILYDKEQGFSFIDLGTKFQEGQETVSGTAQELLKSIKPVFANNELFGDFESRLVSIAKMLGVKIPQAAKNAERAIDELKVVENQDYGSDDAAETIAKENGVLEDKLELLRDIAEQYGHTITQKQRDRFEELNQKDMNEGLTPKEDERYWELGEQIEEADSALEEFEQTYDRIIVKLANGKNIEILPDDKGLRTLAKIDEEYGESYNGIEIEDVIYERIQKEAVAAEQAVDALNDSVEETRKNIQKKGVYAFSASQYDKYADYLSETPDDKFVQEQYEKHKNELLDFMGNDPDSVEQALKLWKQQIESRMATINEAVKRVSKMSAIPKELTTSGTGALYQEAAKVGQQLSTMYDDGITDTEEYIALQHKLLKLFDTIANAYGGVKGSGAKDRYELDTWMYRNLKEDTGFDIHSGNTIDALYEGTNPVYDEKGKKRSMRDQLADLLEYKSEVFSGSTGFEIDTTDLKEVEELLRVIEKRREELFAKPMVAVGTGDTSSAELEAAVTKTEVLQDEVEQKNQELVNKDAEIARIQAESEAEKRALDDAKATLQNDLDETRQQLADAEYTRDLYDSAMNQLTEESNEKDRIIYDLREQLANVKTGVSEEQASVSSDELKNVLSSIVYNVKIAHDDNDKTANKIAIDESVLESTLKRVFTNVLNPQIEQNDSEQKNGSWALESTLQIVKGVLDNIQTNTAKIGTTPQTAANDVDSTLAVISKNVADINTKVVKGTKATTTAAKNTPKEDTSSSASTTTVKTLSKLYKEYGALMERAGAADRSLAEQLYDEAEDKLDEIAALEKIVQKTPEVKQQLSASIEEGSYVEGNKQYRALAKKDDADELSRLKNIAKLQKEISVLKAESDSNANSGVKGALEAEVSLREDLIELQEQGLKMDADIEAYYRKRLSNETKQAKKDAAQEVKDAKDAFKEADKAAKKQAAEDKRQAKRNAMFSKAGNAIGRAENLWMSAQGEDEPLPPALVKRVDALYDKMVALRAEQDKVRTAEIITEEDQKNLRNHTIEVNSLTNEVSELFAEYQKLSGKNVQEIGVNTLDSNAGLGAYEQQLKQAVITATNGKAQIKNFDAATKTLTYTVKTGKNEFTEYTAAVRRADGALVSVQGTTKKTETFFEATARKMRELTSYFSGMAIFNRVGQELRRGVQYVREIDLALTELKKVTDETEETYDKFLDTAAKTGARLGSTISAVTEATATFAKLGYSISDATEMAEAAIVYKNVGDNIASTEDAADSIISTMKGFKLEATESMEIVDRFNEVGNRFAITSQGIGEALRLSASALSEGGNSLDESIGLITAANEVVNDPSSVGKNKLADIKSGYISQNPEVDKT